MASDQRTSAASQSGIPRWHRANCRRSWGPSCAASSSRTAARCQQLVEQNNETMMQRSLMLDGTLPVRNYQATLKVVPVGDGCGLHVVGCVRGRWALQRTRQCGVTHILHRWSRWPRGAEQEVTRRGPRRRAKLWHPRTVRAICPGFGRGIGSALTWPCSIAHDGNAAPCCRARRSARSQARVECARRAARSARRSCRTGNNDGAVAHARAQA